MADITAGKRVVFDIQVKGVTVGQGGGVATSRGVRGGVGLLVSPDFDLPAGGTIANVKPAPVVATTIKRM